MDRMQKLSELRNLSVFRSLVGSTSTAMKAPNSKLPSDVTSSSYGCFANLKITAVLAERLLEEQASVTVKTGLEMVHTILTRATEQINLMEGKHQQSVNENAMLKVKQTEDSNLWQGLHSGISSTKTLWDQLTETMQQLGSQTEQAEKDKKCFEEKLGKSSKALDELNCLLHDLSMKLEFAEEKIISGNQVMLQIKQEKEEIDRSYKEQLYTNDTNIKGKDSLIQQLEGSVDENKSHLQCMEQELKLKDDVCISLKENLASSESEKMIVQQELLEKILKLESDNQELQGQVQPIKEEKPINSESRQGDITKREQQVETHGNQINHLCSFLNQKEQLYSCTVERDKTFEDQKLQVEASLSAIEYQLSEAKKQFDLMLQDKQIELSKHLNELSLQNDQVINEICKKHELEKTEITNVEKEKEEKQREIEAKCNEKISENKQDSESYLVRLKEERGTMVKRIQQDNEHIESMLWSYHKEELQRIQSQTENELRKQKQRALVQVMGENQQVDQEVNTKKVERTQHDNDHKDSILWSYQKEELRRIQSQAENELRKEKQRTLLQVMGENQQVDREVNTKKEHLTSLLKMRDLYGRKEHEISTNSVRSLHSTAIKDTDKKEKAPTNQRYPGNTATVILDRDRPEASLRSYKRAIRKARLWCRSTSKPIDLSDHFGPGAEVFTTPADGTFHLTFEYDGRRLTLFICGRNLYVKGWHSQKNGTFELVKDFIRDSTCKFVDTGENYHDICRCGEVAKVRIGLEPLIESFEVMDKCTGVVTTDLVHSIAMFCVGTSESIRLQDVFEEYIDSFLTYYPNLGPDTPFWIRRYGYYSKQYLNYLHEILSGDPPPKINNRGGNVTSILELRHRIRVPLRTSLNEGKFQHEKRSTPVWSPPYADGYADGKDWDDKQLDEDDEKYWPRDEDEELEDEELKSCESDVQKQYNKAKDIRVQKADMNTVKDHIPINRSSIVRFSTAVTCDNKDFLGTHGPFGSINTVKVNTTHCQPFLTASCRNKVSEGRSSFPWRPQSFSTWRKLQFFTKIIRKFL